jgi:hypothetical protein
LLKKVKTKIKLFYLLKKIIVGYQTGWENNYTITNW